MGLLGEAVLAMWWDIPPKGASEFEDWHSREHMPERLAIPGFLRGSRWADISGRPSYFQRYEVRSIETLVSKPYLERLNQPTPWSRKMFLHYFRNMTRSFCRVPVSLGSGLGQTMLTIRFSPSDGRADALQEWLTGLLADVAQRSGMAGAHLLRTEGPIGLPETAEQQQRGGDAVADWILLANGYDSSVVESLLVNVLDEKALVQHGASPHSVAGVYRFAFALTTEDASRPDERVDKLREQAARAVKRS